jgi:hypothetical protein
VVLLSISQRNSQKGAVIIGSYHFIIEEANKKIELGK